mmetsp:Transcript_14863/g.27029  ORF Transcript_14863/g.27029 Transcript_14863/m.27029 type:complete len:122 (-) Transcript_14863:490-855(-)
MPTHDSKRKRLSMSMEKMAPGVDEKMVDSTGRDVKVESMRGAEELMDSVAVPMATAAIPSIPTAKFSVDIALLFPFLSTFFEPVNWPNRVDPRRQLAMKQENTVPYGVPIATDESVANLAK